MEPIAVNRITVTRDLFGESHEAVFSHRRQKTLLWCGIIFAAFGLVLLALQSRAPAAQGLYLPLLLTGGVVILWAATLKKSDLSRKWRAFQGKSGDQALRTVTFDRTGMTVDTGQGEPARIEYTEIRETRETPRLYLLLCSGHRGVLLAKDGFEKGSWDAVLQAEERAKQEEKALQELL